MAVDKARRVLPFNQILLILMGILLLYLMVDFGRQVAVSRQRREELAEIEREIEAATQESAELDSQLSYVSSPEAAEAWARPNGWTRPDEVLVVFVGPTTDSAASGQGRDEARTSSESPRDAWWDLFFGTR